MDENNQENQVTQEETNEQGQTFTQEEVMALVQKEADKRVTQALKRQQLKYEKQLSLSQLDGEARTQAEKDSRIAELEQQLAEFNMLQVKNEVVSVLTERGLSPKFADYLALGEDTVEAQTSIDGFDKLFKAEVEKQVKARINSTIPNAANVATTGLTKEQFEKMSIREKSNLLRQDPELYNSLIK